MERSGRQMDSTFNMRLGKKVRFKPHVKGEIYSGSRSINPGDLLKKVSKHMDKQVKTLNMLI